MDARVGAGEVEGSSGVADSDDPFIADGGRAVGRNPAEKRVKDDRGSGGGDARGEHGTRQLARASWLGSGGSRSPP